MSVSIPSAETHSDMSQKCSLINLSMYARLCHSHHVEVVNVSCPLVSLVGPPTQHLLPAVTPGLSLRTTGPQDAGITQS